MAASMFTCRECGVGFRRIETEWRRDEVLICPNCGGIDLVVVLDPVARWRPADGPGFVGDASESPANTASPGADGAR